MIKEKFRTTSVFKHVQILNFQYVDSQSPGTARTAKSLSVAWKEGQRQPRKASTGEEVQYLRKWMSSLRPGFFSPVFQYSNEVSTFLSITARVQRDKSFLYLSSPMTSGT